ncbi:MAG: hypothetical protein P8N31_05985 [Planctomycetota bacterium]|nr:hypothetical protein [Planctomycetota bacterium]MDG2143083.1 hypothetical protein [Planctomycetota bacterium]
MPSPASPSQPALQRAAWLLLFCAALATVYGLGPVVEAWTTAGPMESSAAGSLGYMLALAATGRILMAWLPPGFPGEHGLVRRDSGGLACTWAASHALGLCAFGFVAPVIALCEGFLGVPSSVSIAVLACVLGLLLAASLLTRPGAMVPRHGMAGIERPARLSSLLLGATALVAVAPLLGLVTGTGRPLPLLMASFTFRPETTNWIEAAVASPATSAAAFAATIVLLGYALAAAHLGALWRRSILLLFALLPAGLVQASWLWDSPLYSPVPKLALLFTGATALGYIALRRADRRAATLAAIAFTALPFHASPNLAATTTGLALAGVLSLLILTPSNGRARSIKLFATCLAVTIAAGILRFPTEHFAALPTEDLPAFSSIFQAALYGYSLWFGILFALIDVTGIALLVRRPWRQNRTQSLPRPELAFVFAVALFGWLLPTGLEIVVEGMHLGARAQWQQSIFQLLVLLAGPGVLMVATGLPALFPSNRGELR